MKKLLLSAILLLGLQNMAQNTIPEGAVNGLFSVSAGKEVYFSKGNLQYQASTNTWRFAEKQWVFLGGTNSKISPTNNDWIDLFGWGTSGYNHGAKVYQPWGTEKLESYYFAYSQNTNNLYDQSGKADWGYNAISNGGNQTNLWRTLTENEWNYLLNERQTKSGYRFAKACLKCNGRFIDGIILFPDNWIEETFKINYPNNVGFKFKVNTLFESDWNTLEAHGAVFIPMTGMREGNEVSPFSGHYWSSSASKPNNVNDGDAQQLFFGENNGIKFYKTNRYMGLAVRLVQDYSAE